MIITEGIRGPWYQSAGGIWYVDSAAQFDELAAILDDTELAGLDTETDGCDPKKESPVNRARITVASVSWIDAALGLHPNLKRPLANRVMVPNFGEAEKKGWFYKLGDWLESEKHGKVGHNIFSFDRHAFANMGINLKGIRGDTLRMSREQDVTQKEHDLKAWLGTDTFAYELWGHFTGVFQEPKVLSYARCPRMLSDIAPALKGCSTRQKAVNVTCKGCGDPLVPEVSESQTTLVPWDRILSDPKWFRILLDYSTLDSKGTLELFPYLVDILKKQSWKAPAKLTENEAAFLGVQRGVHAPNMWDFYQTHRNPYMYVLTDMEGYGQKIDPEWCADMSKQAERDMESYERELVQWVGVDMNFASAPQMQHLLYGTGPKLVTKAMKQPICGRGFPIPPMAKKDYSTGESEMPTDAEAIQWLADHVESKRDKEGLKLLLKWKKADGTKTKYLDKLPAVADSNLRIHCQLGPDTETGRLAARNPPVQQMPNAEKGDPYQVREAFTVEPGNILVVGDWSQLEPRIMAHFLLVLFDDQSLADDLKTGDVYLAAALRTWPWVFPSGSTVPDIKKIIKAEDPGIIAHEKECRCKGSNITCPAAWKVYKAQRKDAKILVLSVNYGKTEYGLGNDLRDEQGNPIGTEKAKVKLDQYFAANPGIKRFQKWAASYAFKTGAARTLLGRYRKIPQLRWESRGARKHGERQAGNTPVQGTAADISMKAQLKLNTLPIRELIDLGYFHEELYELGGKSNMNVHDEMHLEGPFQHRVRMAEILREVMESPLEEPLRVPLPAEIKFAMTWGGAK